MLKRFIVVVMILAFTVSLSSGAEAAREIGNGNGREDFHSKNFNPLAPHSEIKGEDWLIYWYICGTDLESGDENGKGGGHATNDIYEVTEVKLPPNVRILIQTGTTSNWHHPIIKKNGRYLYDNSGLRKISNQTGAMYSPETLQNFLEYGEKNFKADRKILIFWDHGGVSGVCTDERYENILNFNDLRSALEKVYGNSPKEIPFEFIGFDTCLMGSYESANNIDGFARYMVASENLENCYGWYYTDWLTELAENPATSTGATLGEKICRGSLEDCERYKDSFDSTFSVVDMSKLDKVRAAHKNFFSQALDLSATTEEFDFATTFDNVIANGRGINSYGRQYVDLKTLAEQLRILMPETSQELLNAISEVIVSKSNGKDQLAAGGLTTYYPYKGKNSDENKAFKAQNCAPQEQKDFYDEVLAVTNTISETPEGEPIDAPRNSRSTSSRSERIAAVKESLKNVPVSIGEDKHLTVQLTPEQLRFVSGVRCRVVPNPKIIRPELGVKDEVGSLVIIGDDVDYKGDWRTGTFHDNFRGVWTNLDGHIIFTNVTSHRANYTTYEVPILLNGEVRDLEIAYDYNEKKYEILSARKKSVRGVASRDTKTLKAGDEITPLFAAYVHRDTSTARVCW